MSDRISWLSWKNARRSVASTAYSWIQSLAEEGASHHPVLTLTRSGPKGIEPEGNSSHPMGMGLLYLSLREEHAREGSHRRLHQTRFGQEWELLHVRTHINMRETGRPRTNFLHCRPGGSKSCGSLLTVFEHREELDGLPCIVGRVTHNMCPMAEPIVRCGLEDHVRMAPWLRRAGMVRASEINY